MSGFSSEDEDEDEEEEEDDEEEEPEELPTFADVGLSVGVATRAAALLGVSTAVGGPSEESEEPPELLATVFSGGAGGASGLGNGLSESEAFELRFAG